MITFHVGSSSYSRAGEHFCTLFQYGVATVLEMLIMLHVLFGDEGTWRERSTIQSQTYHLTEAFRPQKIIKLLFFEGYSDMKSWD